MNNTTETNPLEALDAAHLNAQIAKLLADAEKLQARHALPTESAEARCGATDRRREQWVPPRGWRVHEVIAVAAFGIAMAVFGGAVVAGKFFIGH